MTTKKLPARIYQCAKCRIEFKRWDCSNDCCSGHYIFCKPCYEYAKKYFEK